MLITTLIVFLLLDVAWILYAMKTAPVIDDENAYLEDGLEQPSIG